MSEELKSAGCSASDCASCGENCGSRQEGIPNTISLTLDDDTEVECAVLTIFPVDSTEYIALLPLDENARIRMEKYIFIPFPIPMQEIPCLQTSKAMKNTKSCRSLEPYSGKCPQCRRKRRVTAIIPDSPFFVDLFICGASKTAVSDTCGIVIYGDSIFYKNPLHKSGSLFQFYRFAFSAVICKFCKNMALIV